MSDKRKFYWHLGFSRRGTMGCIMAGHGRFPPWHYYSTSIGQYLSLHIPGGTIQIGRSLPVVEA